MMQYGPPVDDAGPRRPLHLRWICNHSGKTNPVDKTKIAKKTTCMT
jgi:hypothetical protein